MTSHVENEIQARIDRVRAEAERKQRERAEFAAARAAGVARRNAAKLRRLAASPEGSATPAGGAANASTTEENLVPAAIRSAVCPSCRQQRPTRLMTTINLGGAPHDVVKCSHKPCELMWLVRADRPRTAPVAA